MNKDLFFYVKKLLGIYTLEDVQTCPLCGTGEFELYSNSRHGLYSIQLQSCKVCRLVIQSPRLTRESLTRFYNNREYRNMHNNADTKHCEEMFKRGIRRGVYICDFLDKNGIDYKGSSILEIGCAYGGILEEFRRRGCRVKGCDLDGRSLRYGVSRGLDLKPGSIDGFSDKDSDIDIVILSHVLEHMTDPYAFLVKVKERLKSGGILYIEVPGIKNPITKKERYAQISHLIYFNRDTLRTMVEKADFYFINGNEIIQSVFRMA